MTVRDGLREARHAAEERVQRADAEAERLRLVYEKDARMALVDPDGYGQAMVRSLAAAHRARLAVERETAVLDAVTTAWITEVYGSPETPWLPVEKVA